ncbi:MAG: hypothetical protein ACJ72X_06080 [Nitrososphaeraceae archaeon]
MCTENIAVEAKLRHVTTTMIHLCHQKMAASPEQKHRADNRPP